MKAKIFLMSVFAILVMMASGQCPTMELTFTAENNGIFVRLESIKVMNRTHGGDTVLYWPDTVLSYYYLGVSEINKEAEVFQVFQNYPNPVIDQTTISLYVPEKDEVSLIITDILGRVVLKNEWVLEKGHHSFGFMPGSGSLFFFTAQWRGSSSSIKILQTSFNSNRSGSFEYMGSKTLSSQLKTTNDIQSFFVSPGDELLYIGYADTLESGILDIPEESRNYTFQFATNIPCPGTPTVEYEGQVYNTIQIFSQCWLKENLNVGTMIPGSQKMTDNDIMEKYCYYNEPDSCAKYGGLYQWNEMMQYTMQQGAQGICPPGWHIPTDEEWKVLEGVVDSQYGIGDQEWDIVWDYRGYDAGTNLKTTGGWYGGSNGTDLFGFSGLPVGSRDGSGHFGLIGYYGGWWTSMDATYNGAWDRGLDYLSPEIRRYNSSKEDGFSVRCLSDN